MVGVVSEGATEGARGEEMVDITQVAECGNEGETVMEQLAGARLRVSYALELH